MSCRPAPSRRSQTAARGAERSLPPFKGNSPYVRPQAPRAEFSPTRSKALPCDSGAGSRMSCKPAQGRRSQTAAHGAHDRPAVTGDPPFPPRPTGRRGEQPCRRHAAAPDGRASPTSDTPAWKPRPTRQATGAPVAACRQPHRHLCHRRASSVAEPVPRLEATQRTTQQRQPGATVKAAESGPAVMAVAGGRAQRGLGPACHASRLRAEEAKPPRMVRTTVQRLQATPHFRPDQRAEGASSHAGGMQPRQMDALLQLLTRQLGSPGPRAKQPARQLLHAGNRTATCATVAPLRLRNQYRDSRRPSARPSSASLARRSKRPKVGRQ